MAMSMEMVCTCEAMISITTDADDNTPIWYMVYRFADAHVGCNYVTERVTDKTDAGSASS